MKGHKLESFCAETGRDGAEFVQNTYAASSRNQTKNIYYKFWNTFQ